MAKRRLSVSEQMDLAERMLGYAKATEQELGRLYFAEGADFRQYQSAWESVIAEDRAREEYIDTIYA